MFNDRDLVGLTEEAAREKAASENVKMRVRSRDGVEQVGTCDFRTDRLNVSVKDGIVDAVQGRG